jgi:hypothetical protein
MDMRRFLPIILIAFAALFILPQLFKHSSSKTLSAKERGTLTLDAMKRIDAAEQQRFRAKGAYTDRLADLVARDQVLGSELTIPLVVNLDVSADGKSYLAQVTSDIFSLSQSRAGAAPGKPSCRELKATAGVDCPAGTAAPTTTTSTTTTPTTTTTLTTGTVTTVTTNK